MSSTHPLSHDDSPLTRVMALHALSYCPRLFYLEEVEEIRVADAAVWGGRTLHEELDEDAQVTTLTLESRNLGIKGKLDAVRRRSGESYPIEHKRGRARRDEEKTPCAWQSDRVQALAYALLLEEHLGEPVSEARIRYHADQVTVRIVVDEPARQEVHEAISQARRLREKTQRPPITDHPSRCASCSLAPVCLPEEARLAEALAWKKETTAKPTEESSHEDRHTLRLFPPDPEARSFHVVKQGAKVGVSRGRFKVTYHKECLQEMQAHAVSDVTLHGNAQISTQCLKYCAAKGIDVHWMSMGGSYVGSFFGPNISVQRKLRQYEGLRDEELRRALAVRLVEAKLAHQRQHVMRASRKDEALRARLSSMIQSMRQHATRATRSEHIDELRGHEGMAARAYFRAIAELVHPDVSDVMRPDGRNRRPPTDRFNALLSFLYAQLYRDVLSAIIRVGLEPAMGLMHTPRSATPPLVLDLMELFRVPVVDMAVLGAVNRQHFDEDEDFQVTSMRVWLSESGRKKALQLYERRKHEEYRHPVLEYSLSYARHMELEVRLLEKE